MGLSFGEIIVVAIFGLIFIGPKDLPRVMRQFGRWLRQLKNLGESFMSNIDKELADPKKYIKDLNGNLQETFTIEHVKKLP